MYSILTCLSFHDFHKLPLLTVRRDICIRRILERTDESWITNRFTPFRSMFLYSHPFITLQDNLLSSRSIYDHISHGMFSRSSPGPFPKPINQFFSNIIPKFSDSAPFRWLYYVLPAQGCVVLYVVVLSWCDWLFCIPKTNEICPPHGVM